MHEQQLQSTNPPNPTEYNPKRWLNDKNFCIQVERSMSQLLTILGLGFGASKTEIRVCYQQLARKYHPDKNSPAITGLSASEASAFFQLLNNVHEYLKDRA
jgi:DnaJ-class molecular chaperone